MNTRGLKITVTLLVLGLICGNCWAADANTTRTQKREVKIQEKENIIKDRQQLRLDEMTKNLNLTPAQVSQIKGFFANEDNQINAVLQNTALNKQQRETQIKEIRESTNMQIEGVLTPQQKEKQKQLAQERKLERKEHHNGQNTHDSNSVKQ
jgi:Spy/CpxP family protein refolding chaperone